MTTRRAAHRRGVRLGDAGLLTATPLYAMILVSLVRTSHPPKQQARALYSSRLIIPFVSCGSSPNRDWSGNNAEPQETAGIFVSKMTGLNGNPTAQALTI